MGKSIAIIGGGILGHVTAWRFSQSFEDVEITIYEQGLVGSGASQRSAGVHFPVGRLPQTREMTQYSEACYAAEEPFAHSAAIRSVPMLVAGPRTEAFQEHFTQTLEYCRSETWTQTFLEGGCHQVQYRCSGAQFAEVHRLVEEIAAHLGATVAIHEGTRISEIEESQNHVRVECQNGKTAQHDIAILVPGPWSCSAPFARWTEGLGLRIKRVVALHIPDDTLTKESPLLFFPKEDAFLLPRAHRGEWLFSYTNTTWDQCPDEIGPDLTPDDIAAGRSVLQQIAPKLAPRIAGGRVFCDTYTHNRVPLTAALSASGRLLYGGGANGSGYRLAPAMARNLATLADAALGQPTRIEELV